MARLVAAYPEWISSAEIVGTTRQGRPIQLWCVGPGGCAPPSPAGPAQLPSVLYTALVHAREPATLMCLVHALRKLLLDAASRVGGAHRLLASRKLLFMPIANPDGYAWNERTRPRGGGMKRKNGARSCSPPDTENDGVDLNRNFGYKYAYDSVGSSSRGCSEEYRGTSAFSEPETQAIRAVVTKHKPKAVLHWHGWGNDIAFPYSYDWRAPMSNEDLGLYQEFAAEMAASNHYASGRAWESVGYTTNGEADDWGWGEHHAVSLTIEVGSSDDGFWPSPSRILPIAQESAWPAHYLAWSVGPMLQLDSLGVTLDSSGKGGQLKLQLQNNGLGSYDTPHLVCLHATPPHSEIRSSAGWELAPHGEGGGGGGGGGAPSLQTKACLTLAALGSRSYRALPPISVGWLSTSQWLSLTLTVHPPDLSDDEASDVAAAVASLGFGVDDDAGGGAASRRQHARRSLASKSVGRAPSGAAEAGGGVTAASTPRRRGLLDLGSIFGGGGGGGGSPEAAPAASQATATPRLPGRTLDAFRLRILNSPSTLNGCDELCLCSTSDNARVDFSHECRAAIGPGSHCRVAKPAHQGTNWASGVIDEHFHYQASAFSKGGKCTIGATKRDTLLAVYASCARFGSQSPVGFANSEGGRTATVSFPCTAGTSYYIFWNAEYMPGRFPFTITEACGGGECVRAHRFRAMRQMLRQKKRRRAMK